MTSPSLTARCQTLSAALILALALAGGARAQGAPATGTAAGSSIVAERVGIEVTGKVIFQNLLITPSLAAGTVITTQSGTNVTVVGSDAVSLAVPNSFDMTRAGGNELLTVLTTADGRYFAVPTLFGMMNADGALSLDVGGSIRVSADQLAPGEYRGLLVIIAQYN